MGQRGADDASKVEMNRGQRRSKPFERVRRPADLLLALFALALIATVLGLIRTLPIGSTELSNDVTRWLFHIPRWLSSSAEVVAAIGGLALVVVALVVLLRSELRGPCRWCRRRGDDRCIDRVACRAGLSRSGGAQ